MSSHDSKLLEQAAQAILAGEPSADLVHAAIDEYLDDCMLRAGDPGAAQ